MVKIISEKIEDLPVMGGIKSEWELTRKLQELNNLISIFEEKYGALGAMKIESCERLKNYREALQWALGKDNILDNY